MLRSTYAHQKDIALKMLELSESYSARLDLTMEGSYEKVHHHNMKFDHILTENTFH